MESQEGGVVHGLLAWTYLGYLVSHGLLAWIYRGYLLTYLLPRSEQTWTRPSLFCRKKEALQEGQEIGTERQELD